VKIIWILLFLIGNLKGLLVELAYEKGKECDLYSKKTIEKKFSEIKVIFLKNY